MKKLFFLISILLLIGCSKKELSTYDEMKSDKLMSESFTDNELENLAKIVDFFEGKICNNIDNFEKCYKKLLRKDSTKLANNKRELYNFDYNEQEKLYSNLDSTFFNNFWYKSSGDLVDYDYYYLKVFNKKKLSRYMSFLKKFSKINKYFKDYVEIVEISNDFSMATGPINLIYHHNYFNKKDIKIRLIYSFHYLNINEDYDLSLKNKK